MQHAALHNRLQELATDVGRLRRRLEPGTSLAWTGERIACHTFDLIGMVEPSAAQIAACTYPGDEQTITEAIRLTDLRHERLRRQLGWTT